MAQFYYVAILVVLFINKLQYNISWYDRLIQLNGFYIPFQLIYGYVETNDDNDDKTETWPPSQGQVVFFTSHPDRNGMRCLRLVTLYGMHEDTVGVFLPQTRTGNFMIRLVDCIYIAHST